jgi:hypothetical protein
MKTSYIIRVIKSRRMRWTGHVASTVEMRNALGIAGHRWEDNIRMDLREIWWEGLDWIHLAEDRDQWRAVMNTVMNLRVH